PARRGMDRPGSWWRRAVLSGRASGRRGHRREDAAAGAADLAVAWSAGRSGGWQAERSEVLFPAGLLGMTNGCAKIDGESTEQSVGARALAGLCAFSILATGSRMRPVARPTQ